MKSSRNKKTAATRRATAARKTARPASRTKKSAPPASAVMATTQPDAVAADAATAQVATPVATLAAPAAAAASVTPQRAGLKLEATFTLRDANDMLFQLLAVDFGDSDVLVDGGAVERIDTAGLQMLIAFAKSHAARGKTLHWTAVSPELLRSSQLLGVTEPLHLAAHLGAGASGGH
jgi:anti-anti-sigma regulatory factor